MAYNANKEQPKPNGKENTLELFELDHIYFLNYTFAQNSPSHQITGSNVSLLKVVIKYHVERQ